MYMYQGLGQMLTKRLQHHQGCSETPKFAYVIYGQPLRLAGQFDTKERFISLAEQNWMNLAPLREYFFGRTGLSFGRKK